jgi:hypothetical protein
MASSPSKEGQTIVGPFHMWKATFCQIQHFVQALNGKRTFRKNKLFDNNVRRCYMRARSELAPISPPIRMDGALMISLFHPYVYQAG